MEETLVGEAIMRINFRPIVIPALATTVLTSGPICVTARLSAHSPSAVTISSKEASKEEKGPVAIDIGEVVKGRLGDSRNGAGYHYWSAKAPAGRYRLVLDVKVASDQRRNLQSEIVALRPDGTPLGKVLSANEVDSRLRSVAEFDSTKHPEFVLRVGNNSGIVDYWLGVFPVDAEIPVPYFVDTPTIEPLGLGQSLSAVIDAKPGSSAEAWYSVKLKAADYRVMVEFSRADGRKSNVQGEVVMFGSLGQRFSRGNPMICRVNEVDTSGKCVAKLILSEDMDVLFRVAPTNDASYKTVFSVEPQP
jgi:hypothetical protein